MRLWKQTSSTNSLIEKFTIGKDREMDLRLAKFDVLGSIGHVQMLGEVNIISTEEAKQLIDQLNLILTEIESGQFSISEHCEDIHSQIEFQLTEKLGDVGKKVHTARSRNDQSLLDIKLYIRHELQVIESLMENLFTSLIHLAKKHEHDLLPGYSHYQLAMPSSFGLWFSAYAESLSEDLEVIHLAYSIANKNPLGSAAGYGSSFPIDRNSTTASLGFASMNVNSVYAQMTRGKTEKICASALGTVASTLSKLASDITLFMNQEFNYVSFPAELTTGSSIMPHKKNPDVWELIRAKANRIQSIPNELALLLGNLPSGYHRDFQLTKEILFPAIDELKSILDVANFTIQQIVVRENILHDEKYDTLFTVDAINKLVQEGVSFRDAYKIIGKQVNDGTFERPSSIQHSHTGSIGNLSLEKISFTTT